ncbi:lipoate--protein ligase family protein [Paenalkalicoccus suaedae]|uniref:Octanoyl-[GcvH]:protein N-octanoyltransferase n=1 Tax=Paenalkalicoccus suaedae TaxID=2592382 RepID=A0A859FJ35_9BACI|nr:lipoate--protein ligase family protein [Paenalkalicoccus suaedae]QKS72822.1 lipoate--protein ligase family protein [Paenalkalicoccus suaedae]
MTQSLSPLGQKQWLLIDQSVTGLTMNPMESFATDDTLCRHIATQEDTGIARTWVHDKTVVLGIQDSRLPHIQDGISYLQEQGYRVIVRNSGGLAVVLDEDVYNLSLLFKEERGLTIDRSYEAMVEFTQELLPEFGSSIVDGEVETSYCPGRYDLSVDGKKFAGISQRRIRGGVAVQIYLAMKESGAARAELIRTFYERAVQGAPTSFTYPQIVPETMASLAEHGKPAVSNKELTERIEVALRERGMLQEFPWTEEHEEMFQYNLERMVKRNEKVGL